MQAELAARLAGALQAAGALAAEEKVVSKDDALDNVAEAAAKSEGLPALAPGTQHVGEMVSAKVLHSLIPSHAITQSLPSWHPRPA